MYTVYYLLCHLGYENGINSCQIGGEIIQFHSIIMVTLSYTILSYLCLYFFHLCMSQETETKIEHSKRKLFVPLMCLVCFPLFPINKGKC